MESKKKYINFLEQSTSDRNQRKVYFSSTKLILILFFGISCLFSINYYTYEKNKKIKKNIVIVKNELKEIEKKAYKIMNKLDKKEGKNPKELINELQEKRDKYKSILSSLGKKSINKIKPFSSYFESLGRRKIEGLWFEEISVKEDGNKISLIGITRDPKLVSKLINSLKDEKSFEGINFLGAEFFKNHEDKNNSIKFKLFTEVNSE